MSENKKPPHNQKKEKSSTVKNEEGVDKKNSEFKSNKSSSKSDKNSQEEFSSNSTFSKQSKPEKNKKNNHLILFVVFLVLISFSLFLYFNSNVVIERFNLLKDSFFSSKKIQIDSIEVDKQEIKNDNDNISNTENNLIKKKYESKNAIEESSNLYDDLYDSTSDAEQQENSIDELRSQELESFEKDLNDESNFSHDNQNRPEINGYEESDRSFYKNENSKFNKLSSEQISLINELQLLVDEIDNLEFSSIPSSKKDNSLVVDSDSTILERVISQLKGLINVRKINDPKANIRTNNFFIIVKQQMKIYLLTSRMLIASELLVNAKADLNLSLKILDEYFDEQSEVNQNYRNKLLFLIKKLEIINSS